MNSIKYLVAMRRENGEQFLKIVDGQSDKPETAYNKINNILRSRTSTDTFEKSRRLTPETEDMFKLYEEQRVYDQYRWDSWERRWPYSAPPEVSCASLHCNLYKFLRCKRDVDFLKPEIKEIASVYGLLPDHNMGGYPIVYLYQDMDNDELVELCAYCANHYDADAKQNIVTYQVLEGDTRDHGEIFCGECSEMLTPTEFVVTSYDENEVPSVVYSGDDMSTALKFYDDERQVPGVSRVTIEQDEKPREEFKA